MGERSAAPSDLIGPLCSETHSEICDLRLATCDRHHMHASFPEMGRRAVVNLLRVIDIAARAGGRSTDTFSFWKL
jgi:hypothetical protein